MTMTWLSWSRWAGDSRSAIQTWLPVTHGGLSYFAAPR